MKKALWLSSTRAVTLTLVLKVLIASVLNHLTYSYMRANTSIVNHMIVCYCLSLWLKQSIIILFFICRIEACERNSAAWTTR